MIKSAALAWLLPLLALIICGSACAAEPVSSNEMACPAVKETYLYRPIDSVKTMPGSESLATGIIWMNQGRYAAAYTALEDAVNQGLPDSVERAHAYIQMGLIMCRLDSAETCQRNLEKAFMTNGPFELPASSYQLPNVQRAYALARQYFETRCWSLAPRIETRVDSTNPGFGSGEAVLLLNVQPWAIVAVDGAAVLTPPTKKIMVKSGKRIISIKHPEYGASLLEGNFRDGEVWVIKQIYYSANK